MRLLHLALLIVGLCALEAVAAPLWKHKVESLHYKNLSKKPALPKSRLRHEWHEPRNTRGWVRGRRASPKGKLPMRVGLKQPNVEKAREALMNMLV